MNYLFNRWIFSRKFKRADEGYLYHKWLGSGGVPVSVEERDECLRLYRHRYWRLVGWGVGVFFLGALLLVVLAVFSEQPSSGVFIEYSTYSLVGVFMIWFLVAFQRLGAIPSEVFGGRLAVVVDEGWGARILAREAGLSWLAHASWSGVSAVLVWLFFPSWPDATMGAWLWWGFWVFSLTVRSFGAWVKWNAAKASES